MFKKGDTLIEVMLAIGIFSMIAIAVTAVMSSGSSSAQTALETTLTREEIDTQAEAIRFIQASYAVNKGSANDTYAKLWKDIIAHPAPATDAILQYAPETCEEIYNSDIGQYAFIINPRALSSFSSDGSQSAVIPMNGNTGPGNIFHQTSTYPRLIFGSGDTTNDLLNNSLGDDSLFAAEGLYVIAVKDNGTTNVVDAAGDAKNQGFYDFFIRSCWYGTDADRPTTISTVIRLYDPDAITTTGFVRVEYDGVNGPYPPGFDPSAIDTSPKEGRRVTLPRVNQVDGWEFVWKVAFTTDASVFGDESYSSGAVLINNVNNKKVTVHLVGQWQHIQYKINYATNPATTYPTDYDISGIPPAAIPMQTCYYDNRDDAGNPVNCILNNNISGGHKLLKASGYRVIGWCNTPPSRDGNGTCGDNHRFALGANINDASTHGSFKSHFNKDHEMTLYPIWIFNNETINIKTEWTSDCSEGRTSPYGCDYDSYMKLQDPNGSGYLDASWSTGADDARVRVTVNGETYQLVVGQGDGRGSINRRYYESFEIKTLGGKNYYYSIKNWSNPPGIVGDDITVTVSGPYTGTYTFRSDHLPSSSCKYWNVFAYIDGEVYERNTCTDSTEIWTP